MVQVSGSNITMTRGDTLLLKINIYKDDIEYIPATGDSVRFAMKAKYGDDETVLIRKDIPTDTLLLELLPSDTKSLDMTKKYVYDIQLTTAKGRIDTFIKGAIQLTEEVD